MQLYTAGLERTRIQGPRPSFHDIPLPHPAPGQDIGITRVHTRIHVLKTTPSLYAAVLRFTRLSDMATIGDAACEIGLLYTKLSEIVVDSDTNYNVGDQQHFRLNAGDSLIARFRTHAEPALPVPEPFDFLAEIRLVYLYAKINPAFGTNPNEREFL